MSWDSITSQEYLGSAVSHQLSATRLLSSPDGSRHPLDTSLGWPPWISTTDLHDRSHSGSLGSARPASALGLASRAAALPIRDSGGYSSQERGYGASRWGETRSGGCSSSWWGEGSILGCFRACQQRIHHGIAKRKMEQGVKLYNQHKQQAAVRKWRSALKAIKKREDKFVLLGYLYMAYMDWGKYRDSLEFAHRQLCISEELDSANMRAESYMNLARAHERLGGLERALAYARQSLYNECEQCTTAGHVHLTVGSVYLELAGFNKALDSFQHAHKIAQTVQDPALELQVYVGLSELFSRLQDADKSARYAAKAYDLSRSLQLGDLNSRHHRAALLQMASALRKQGELGDAQDYCSEATRLALVSGDQATYARSIRIMGDIYRKKSDINKAFRQYESAMGSAAAMGDRVIQMESMDGAARCLEALRLQHKICNCRPLEFNTRLLEVASSVGSKLLVRSVRSRLARIYASLGDEEQRQHHERVVTRLTHDLDLQCGACGAAYGLEADSLEALPCAHILHARCAHDILRRRDKRKKRACPDCQRAMSSRLFLNVDCEPQPLEQRHQRQALHPACHHRSLEDPWLKKEENNADSGPQIAFDPFSLSVEVETHCEPLKPEKLNPLLDIKTVSKNVDFLDSSSQVPTPPIQSYQPPKLKTVNSRIIDLFDSSSELPTPPKMASNIPKNNQKIIDIFSSSSELPTPPKSVGMNVDSVANDPSTNDSSSGVPTPPKNPARGKSNQKSELLHHEGHECLKNLNLNRQFSFREIKKDKKKLVYSTSLSIEDKNLEIPLITTDFSPIKSSQVKQNLLKSTHFPTDRNPICRHHSISPIKDIERKKNRLRSEHSLEEQFLQIPIPNISQIPKHRSFSSSDYLTVQNLIHKKRSNSHSDYLELKEFNKNLLQIPKHTRSSSYTNYSQINPDIFDLKDTLTRKKHKQTDDDDFHLTLSPKTSQIISNLPEDIKLTSPISPIHATIIPPTQNIPKNTEEYYSIPVDTCPKHSPQNVRKSSLNLPPEKKFDRQLSQEECLQILPPPLEYSPRFKHKMATQSLLSIPQNIPQKSDLLDIEISPPSQFSPKNKTLTVEDLDVPPPPQFSPRSSFKYPPKSPKTSPKMSPRKKIQLPALPVEFSPRKSRNEFWDSYITDSVATHTLVKPVQSKQEVLLPPSGKNLSPTRLERFLNQAVTVQSKLEPIRPPKGSLVCIGGHKSLEKKYSLEEKPLKFDLSPIKTRRNSVHSTNVVDTYLQSYKNISNPEICQNSPRKTEKYNITSIISPRQMEHSLSPENHSFLKPRRSWQGTSVSEVALSPIWLPKEPLEPPPKPRRSKNRPKLSESLSVEIPISPYLSRRDSSSKNLLKQVETGAKSATTSPRKLLDSEKTLDWLTKSPSISQKDNSKSTQCP